MMSHRYVAAVAAVAVCALTVRPALSQIESTFDTGLDGWEAAGIEVTSVFGVPPFNLSLTDNIGDMVHDSVGGNPGGYARLTDLIEDPGSFASAPPAFLGDLTPFIGGTFSFDHRVFDTGQPNSGIQPRAVLFVSGDLNDHNVAGFAFDAPAGATGWDTLSVGLNSSEMILLEDLDLAIFGFPGVTAGTLGVDTTMTFEQIMADVDTLLVAFELVDNDGVQQQEHAGIDNVRLVIPEPAAAMWLAAAGLGLRRRHRYHPACA